MSDSFASALWGADLMYRLAAAGSSGINFHGGGYGWYTPIAGTVRNGFLARPLYYGMLLFAVADAGRLIRADLTAIADAPQLSAYGIESREGVLATVVFNKHLDRGVALTIDVPSARNASVIRLIAPRADDATDTTLGGSVVGRDGGWSPQTAERLAERDGAMTLTVPRASGALVTFA